MLLCHTALSYASYCVALLVTLSANSAGNFTGSERTGDLQLIGLTKNRETEKNQRDGSVEKIKVRTGTDVCKVMPHLNVS